MIRFSVVIPVYNVEKYLCRCLESLENQTFKNFETIIVCDKSKDNSEEVVDKYVERNHNFKKINANNTGLSEARNIGINKAKGEYLLLLDGDDFFENILLEIIDKNLADEPEIIRFQIKEVFPNNEIRYEEVPFETMKGTEAFNSIINYHFVENAWSYCYNRKFYIKNNFEFMKDCIAEDYGLLPLVIAKSNKVKSIDFIGYNYVQRENSLMRNNDYNKRLKKMDDMIKQSRFLKRELNRLENTDMFMRFINNSLIYHSTTLKYSDYKKYNKILKNDKCFDYLPSVTLKSKIRKFMIKINSYLFYHLFAR